MYDSHGLQPDTVAEIAAEEGVEVEVPDDFYAQVADRHEERESVGEESDEKTVDDDLPETDLLFYDDADRTEFEAVVLNTYYDDEDDSYEIVLDQTRFYPEGGGQPPDTGVLENGEVAHVEDVQKRDGVVFHRTDKPLSKGDVVRGQVDADRRRALMRNHTATHIVIDAARRVLGDHVRQAGAQKGVGSSRIDITHHRRLTDDEVREIERVANETVRDNVRVKDSWLDRHEAEEEYGFDLYQGGIPRANRYVSSRLTKTYRRAAVRMSEGPGRSASSRYAAQNVYRTASNVSSSLPEPRRSRRHRRRTVSSRKPPTRSACRATTSSRPRSASSTNGRSAERR